MNTLFRLSAFFVSLLLALPAIAAQRTFVASTGVDNSACSLVAPCRGFAAAVTATDPNGEVLVLDSAGYGAVVITKSVSIIAPEGIYAGVSVFAASPNQTGITINGAGIKVVLRGLTINGQGGADGIAIQNAGDVYIEKTTIANTGIITSDAGIRVASTATNARVFVTDTTVRGTGGEGIRVEANATVLVDHSRIEGNSAGIVGQSPGGSLTVNDSLVARNTFDGILFFATAAGNCALTVARSTIEGNGATGVFAGAGTNGTYRVVVTNSVLRDNVAGVFVNAFAGETVTALIGDNRSVGHSDTAIGCSGAAATTVTLVAERNEVLGNAFGLDQSGTCTLKSMGNNTVQNNTADIVGAITPATLR
jgi:parallel beta helix pectate lyase-like protein